MGYYDGNPGEYNGSASPDDAGTVTTQPQQPKTTTDPTSLFGMPPSAAPTPNITTQPTGPRVTDAATGTISPYDAVAGFYKTALGREGSADEINGWLTGTHNNVTQIQQSIYGSPEAQAYAKNRQQQTPTLSAADFIKQWQGSHQATEGVQPLLTAMQQAGYTNVSPFMYGQTPSNNEITLDGQKFKVLGGEGTPGAYWYTGGNDGGGGATGPMAGGTGFADPAYNQLAQLVQDRLGKLSQPLSFPGLDQYVSSLQQDRQLAQQRAQDFASQLSGRVAQLQQPLLTDANVANQRALASNALLASRDSAIKNQREQRFASGFAPTSGLMAGDERAINENYNNRQAAIDAQLQSQMINTDEQRRNQATQLQGIAQQALRGGDLSSLQDQATTADMENQLFNIDQNRQREMLTTANVPVDLTNMGFANASSVANSGGNGLSALLQFLPALNSQQGLQQGQSNSNMQALAFLLNTFLS